jgi:hypothetical protein
MWARKGPQAGFVLQPGCTRADFVARRRRAVGTKRPVGGMMEQFDEMWDDGAANADLELNSDPEELWRSLIPDEVHSRYWSESVWSQDSEDGSESGALLFADGAAESELAAELRLSELWARCDSGCLAMEEFFELSALITRVQGIPGSLCEDCDMLNRANVNANWALAATSLCRSHLRFRLGHARIDGGSGRQ